MEPVVQQAFFTLSPMAGQESFSSTLDRSTSMGHTPTTSSMLAALNDPFPSVSSTLDPTATSFNPSSYAAYMDTSSGGADSAQSSASMSFGEFVPGSGDNSFDVPGFPQDLGAAMVTSSSSGTQNGGQQQQHHDVVEGAVKEEGV